MTDSKKLTVTLSGRPPVRIAVDDWPIIAEATDRNWEGEFEFQSFRTSKASIRVRQHSDGRAIIYGSYSFDTHFQDGKCIELRGGELLDCDAAADRLRVVRAIEDVAEQLAERLAHAGGDRFGMDMTELGQQCVADLPAEDI